MTPAEEARVFPNGRPHIPVWLGWIDNTVTKHWENRATARTNQGQQLLGIYSEMLRTAGIHTVCEHIAGVRNIRADDISRNDFSLPFAQRLQKLRMSHPGIESLSYFLSSPELLQLLTSRLFSDKALGPVILPKNLGRFVPAGSIISGSVSVCCGWMTHSWRKVPLNEATGNLQCMLFTWQPVVPSIAA